MVRLLLICFFILLTLPHETFAQKAKKSKVAVMDTLGKHLTDLDEKAAYIEEYQLKRFGKFVSRRDAQTLVVTLRNKEEIELVSKDEAGEAYYFYDFLPSINCFAFQFRNKERRQYLLVRKDNGNKMMFDVLPIISPDKRRLATFSFYPQNPDLLSRIQIWNVAGKVPKLEKQLLYNFDEDHWQDQGLTIKPKWVKSTLLQYEVASKNFKATKHIEKKKDDWSHVVFVTRIVKKK
ncbi:MAG: hypothetical protein SFU91_14050 [Chloroherpetonaceae bacterium]|nr:hypothetical protein [Chloroherpetonaceae bacterium]